MALERQKCLETLGLSSTANEDEIKRAYRRLALQYHPDKNNNADAKSKFQQISYAYKYLTEGPDDGDDRDQHDVGQFFEQMFRDMFFQQYMFHTRSRHGSPFCFYFDTDDDDDDDDDFFIYCSNSDEEPYYHNRQSNGWFDNSHKTYRNPDKDIPADPKINKKKLRRQMKNKRQRERQKEKRKDKGSNTKTESSQSSKHEQTGSQTNQSKESNQSTNQSNAKSSTKKEETPQNQDEQRIKEKEKKKEEEREKRRIEKEARETVANMLKKQKEKDEREKEKQRLKKEKEEEKDDISDWFFDDVNKSKKSKQKDKKHGTKANQGYRQNVNGGYNMPKSSRKLDNPHAELNINRNNSSQPENKSSSNTDQYSNNSKDHIKPNFSNPTDNLYKNRFDILEDEEKLANIINGLNIDSGDCSDEDSEITDDGQSGDDEEIYSPDRQGFKNGNCSKRLSENCDTKVGDKRGTHIEGRNYQPGSKHTDLNGKKGTWQYYDNQVKPQVFTNNRFKDISGQKDLGNTINDDIPNDRHDCTNDRRGTDRFCNNPNTKPVLNGHGKSKDTMDENDYKQRADVKFTQSFQHSNSQTYQNGKDTQQFLKHGMYKTNKSNNHQINRDTGYNDSHPGANFHDAKYRHPGPSQYHAQNRSNPHAADYSYPYYWEDYIDFGYRGQYGAYRGHGGYRGHQACRGHQEFRGHGTYRGEAEFRGQHGTGDFRDQFDRYRGHEEFRGSNRGHRDHHNGMFHGFKGQQNGFRGQHNGYGVEQNGFRGNRNKNQQGFRGQGMRGQHPNNPNIPGSKIHQQSQEFSNRYNVYPEDGENLSDSLSSLESLDEEHPPSSHKDSIDSISDSINGWSNQNPSNICNSRNDSNRLTNDKLGIPQGMFHSDRFKNYYK